MDTIFNDNQPIYLQIVERICARILRGEILPGEKLPGVIDSAMHFKVNHNTIQRVYLELVRDGIAVSKRGEGTFVTEDTGALQKMQQEIEEYFLATFTEQMLRLGYQKEDIVRLVQAYVSRIQTQ